MLHGTNEILKIFFMFDLLVWFKLYHRSGAELCENYVELVKINQGFIGSEMTIRRPFSAIDSAQI